MLRLLMALGASVAIVTFVTLPLMLYLESLEQQGKLTITDWPEWAAKLVVFLLIATALFLTKVILSLMHRRWPEK